MTKSATAIDIHVGASIRMRRIMLGLSQGKLAEGLGITFQQVQKYEKGINRVGAGRLQRIADLLDVPISFFFEGQPETSSQMCLMTKTIATSQLHSKENMDLVKAFIAIKDNGVRRRVLDLIKSLEGRTEGRVLNSEHRTAHPEDR
ncbi:helix-turn-helix domain-containing protein [Agrobacterium rosae]|uniref:Helix-turn-helix transcriptional regulator n=1 Tax=Agrobacterium rosae TaxID=1972867 RepID=A0ABU4W6Y1_9HYPH|nr:helix-turn-helix transcriptional regulator [Agrobacterium rosae]MDX8333044.1 helix-turn-helix transcriptional regulator [Agrobacterium rosae]